MSDVFPLLTRRQAIELIHTELGVPVPLSRWEKDAMEKRQSSDAQDRARRRPCVTPKPYRTYGRTHLYTRDQVLEYGRSLIEAVEAKRDAAA
jgi:hypothetical protein